jgi:hypothetical protein
MSALVSARPLQPAEENLSGSRIWDGSSSQTVLDVSSEGRLRSRRIARFPSIGSHTTRRFAERDLVASDGSFVADSLVS